MPDSRVTVIADRLLVLSDAVSKRDMGEFTMSVPADLDRDADLVLSKASVMLRDLQSKLDDRDAAVASLAETINGLRKLNAGLESEVEALREAVRWHVVHHPQSWPGDAGILGTFRRAIEKAGARG